VGKNGKLRSNLGFTLIEMAIVLIIIGIIIGAVVKGKDLVRGAEQKKIYSKFLNEWRIGYLNFYDRTGRVLGDTWNGSASGQDGRADTAAGGPGNPSNAGRNALVDSGAVTTYRGLIQVGLNAPTTNTDNAWEYKYSDSDGTVRFLTIAFDFDASSNYNYMEISNIPTELALAIDRMIDDQSDGTAGDFINGTGAADWATTPTTVSTARWKMEF
jgi:prepilin-type N-terminal cleavage/methylation domain-containing protein